MSVWTLNYVYPWVIIGRKKNSNMLAKRKGRKQVEKEEHIAQISKRKEQSDEQSDEESEAEKSKEMTMRTDYRSL